MKKNIYPLLLWLCSGTVLTAQIHPPANTVQQNYSAELKAVGRVFIQSFRPNYVQVYSLPAGRFTAKIDSGRMAMLAVLYKYAGGLNRDFMQQQAFEIDYYFDKLLVEYPDNYSTFTGRDFPYTSAITKRLAKNLPDFNNPALLDKPDFTDYARSFFAFQVRHELKSPAYNNLDNRYIQAIWRLIPQWVSNRQCREFWQCDYLCHHIDNSGIKNIQKIYDNFERSCTDTAYVNRIIKLYDEDAAGRKGHLVTTYKIAGPFALDMHIFLPDSNTVGNTKKPAIVYFHGGSWSEGKPDWFFDACKSYAEKGWVACAVEYRIYGRQGTLPFDAVKDARSAIRWLRKHGGNYNIDTNRIVASGNSAGGHLVLAAALADQWNEKTDDLRFSPAPNVLMVNSGVFDLTDQNTAWIRNRLKNKDLVKQISPNYLVRKGMPPALIIHATNDNNVPYATAKTFEAEMLRAGNPIEFHALEGAGHFIWYDPKYAGEVGRLRRAFLEKLGY